jgi:DNA-binding response OmpR family regulator
MFTSTLGHETHHIDSGDLFANRNWRRSILFVVDDPEAIALMNDRFAHEGYQVRIVSDGLVAMNELRRTLPDIVVADAEGSGISGAQLAEELRDWGLPVVLLGESKDHPIPTGIAVLHDPLNIDELVQTIEEETAVAGESSRVIST